MSALLLQRSDTFYIDPQPKSEGPQQNEPLYYKGEIKTDFSQPDDESGLKSEEEEITVHSQFRVPRPSVLLPIKITPSKQNHFISLQKWEGIVSKVKKEVFLARLVDLTREGPDEEAEIPIEEVSEDDLDLLQPGAVFYWNIGYLNSHKGQRLRTSGIRFRRLPEWTEEELNAARREAMRIRDLMGWK